MPIIRLILIRHGETEWNRQGRIQGHLDSPLTALGRLQASAAGQYLKHQRCDALLHSDLGRALQTARLIAAASGLSGQPEPRLRERRLGIMEGFTKPQFRERYPEYFRAYQAREADFAMPGGESLKQVLHRTRGCFDDLASEFGGATLAIVTHGGILDVAYRMVTGTALEAPRCFTLSNASLNHISRHKNAWRLDRWGDISHLEPLGHMASTMSE